MTRTFLWPSLALLLVSLLPNPVLAKPMPKTPLKVGVKKAQLIVIAEFSRHQFEDLKDGESTRLFVDEAWKQFKVTKVLKNSSGLKIPLKTVVQAPEKCNGCIRFQSRVTRKGNDFHIRPDGRGSKVEKQSLKELRTQQSQKVILFLTVSPQGPKVSVVKATHFGWFLSGTKWSEAYENKVLTAIRKENGA